VLVEIVRWGTRIEKREARTSSAWMTSAGVMSLYTLKPRGSGPFGFSTADPSGSGGGRLAACDPGSAGWKLRSAATTLSTP
jgi:hypothetical protein